MNHPLKGTMWNQTLFLCLQLSLLSLCRSYIYINEIDIDNPSTDATEFIELFNSGTTDVLLDDYSIVLFNGAGSPAYTYNTISLAGAVIKGKLHRT